MYKVKEYSAYYKSIDLSSIQIQNYINVHLDLLLTELE